MEVTLTAKELLNLSRISGRLSGISDGMDSEDFDKVQSGQILYELSEEIFELVAKKIKELENQEGLIQD